MANFISISNQPKKLSFFLNTTFIFLLSISLKTHLNSNESPTTMMILLNSKTSDACAALQDFSDNESRCIYVKSQIGCRPKGYINYLQIFYCTFGQSPVFGYGVLLLWLLVLFYLLGNTAANYFCSSLESLSRILKLSPAIAGITLLSLGNGAPDVFASIISFTRSSNGDFGLNSILGGAFFVSSTVVGIISILIAPQNVSVDKSSFIRDVIFFLFALSFLLLIIVIGKINFLGAICFISIYILYVLVVSAIHFFYQKKSNPLEVSPQASRNNFFVDSLHDLSEMGIPLLGCVDDEKVQISVDKTYVEQTQDQEQSPRLFIFNPDSPASNYLSKFLYILELPLYLPRRMTIPVVSEENWSKPFAVISVSLAPILLAALCNTHGQNLSLRSSLVTYMSSGLIGLVLGNLAYVATKMSTPPKKCLLPWLAGGFLMSVIWTYITAEELVSLLISIGNIFGISPSALGLTVLAWGNSLGDMIANVAMAINGGPDGAQIAISGCYAGPMFNTLVGLGLSFLLSSWAEYPSAYLIPWDPSLYETIAFLMGGLLWALVILPKKNMRLDRFLGVGLLAIYFCFLFLRLVNGLGVLK